MKYNWKFVITGKKNKKMIYMLCQGNNKVDEFVDINLAYHFEQSCPKIDFVYPTIEDYLIDNKKSIEALHAGLKYNSKIVRIDIFEFRRFLKG